MSAIPPWSTQTGHGTASRTVKARLTAPMRLYMRMERNAQIMIKRLVGANLVHSPVRY